ncbi:MAG: amylo-alpha-1,6-glucosidase [Pirellulales bacterium]
MPSTVAETLELHVNPSIWAEEPPDNERLLRLEWLVTNGLGGYASGTVAGVSTRRYHGLLTAALPAPFGRMVMLNHLHEELWFPGGESVLLTGEETPHGLSQRLCRHLKSFFLRGGLPVWHYELDGCLLEKQIWFGYQTNTVRVAYRALESATPFKLSVRPAFRCRHHEDSVSQPLDSPYMVTSLGDRVEVHAPSLPPLRLQMEGRRRRLVLDGGHVRTVHYRVEAARGYESSGPLWSPGFFEADLTAGEAATLLASTDEWDTVLAMTSEESLAAEEERRARLMAQSPESDEVARHLVLAADQFIVAPVARTADVAMAHAAGDEARTVIAGYHWFTDWGRDTMISLEGLTLATGRHQEAKYILRTFARHVRDGLIPNLFPEGEREGLYHTADATLWFFHALDRYVAWTNDREILQLLMPTLGEIVDSHLRGTRFGIGVDRDDGLLSQGAEGYQLTWMDAKVGDWVVTPRRGKAVEINALWYNALRLYSTWLAELGETSRANDVDGHALRAERSFNQRFWNGPKQCLYDVVDGPTGDDASIRPNQLFSIALPNPVLQQARWEPVVKTSLETLLTPMGLRSLAPGEPNYVAKYDGDLRARDAAYHQGTVWGWLVGPLVDAWMKTHPGERDTVRAFLEGFVAHLHEACVGSMSEIFDAEAPYTPRGCVSQAWSVAEVLRCWKLTADTAQAD